MVFGGRGMLDAMVPGIESVLVDIGLDNGIGLDIYGVTSTVRLHA